ncbi:hypothetical protein NQ314_014784 [Rhamnusium bicolor]|uniref:CWH43-like N-terminal domain-containing protein n=1 Tax=Rhamnusium bicolor TaxID=1586634 RepID=A0AAV8X2V3_9CUCU|nr:hypothetical protein NQ314_014784 [Rhamnusium bicolor]
MSLPIFDLRQDYVNRSGSASVYSFIFRYGIAVLEGHLSPLFPYISGTGTTPPESCIFGFMLNIGAILLYAGFYIRYRLPEFIKNLGPECLNNLSHFLGIVCCLGMVTVANFQESNILAVHMLGALCTFGSATIYCCIQVAWITWKSEVSQFLKLSRTFLCIVLIPSFINNILFGNLAIREFKGNNTLKWTKEDDGYNFHLVATFSEWIMAVVLNIYIFSFQYEFKMIRFEGVVFRENDFYQISYS